MAAPTKSPGRKRRSPEHVHDIGNVGRMTGVTLKQRARDEHGLEPPEGIFSPTPGKPSTKKSVSRKSNSTISTSESMQVAESSAPEPTEVLSSRKLVRDGKSILPLPVSRSPIKTHIGTPRRGSSIGALSSPSKARSALKPNSQAPATVKRKLDFSGPEPHGSPYNPRKSPKLSSTRTPHVSSRSGDVDAFASPHSSPSRDIVDNEVGGEFEEAEYEHGDNIEDDADEPGPTMEEEQEYTLEEETELEVTYPSQLADEEPQGATDSTKHRPSGSRSSRGRRSESVRVSESQDAHGMGEGEMYPAEAADSEEGEPIEPEPEEVTSSKQMPKKRGRPPKSLASKGALAPKSANARSKEKTRSKTANGGFAEPQKPRVAQRVRHQTPMEEDGILHTRSGRSVYKPLSYWKGERAVFEERVRDPGVQEIIRVDDVTPVKRPRANAIPHGGRGSRKKRAPSVFEEEVDDDGPEPWETDEGLIIAPVRVWDSVQMMSSPNEEEEQQIAFAKVRMQPRAAPDNPNFMFTKTLTMPFFGSGVIELPAGGMKGLKNSRKFQFVFFVYFGKVAVEVAGTRFIVSKGGMWQVPRGNFYSITNESDHAAKIFFAQSCEVAVEPREPPSLQNLVQ